MSFSYAPLPPVYTTVDGGATSGAKSVSRSLQANSNSNIDADVISDTSSSSSSVSSSMITVIVVISSAIVVTSAIYFFLRFLTRRAYAAAEDAVLRNHNDTDTQSNSRGCHVASKDRGGGGGLHESLPLFTFGSVTGNVTSSGDCAVCLSKFEPLDELRLLPLCCHAFHAPCIDTWLSTNRTCPLCRSTVYPTDADVGKILSISNNNNDGNINSGTFRIEIGSISSRQQGEQDASAGDGVRRLFSVGSFDYIVDNGYEVPIHSTHRRGASIDKEMISVSLADPPQRETLTTEVTDGRSWLTEYIDRLPSPSLSCRMTPSLRWSGRFFSGSFRRSDAVVPVEDVEANYLGEEISEMFRWFSGV